MVVNEMKLGFKYERKRIKRDKQLPALCPDYEPEEGRDNCKKSTLCKNATYGFAKHYAGYCYGGTRSSERKIRDLK